MSDFVLTHPGAFVTYPTLEAAQDRAGKLSVGGKTYEVYRLECVCTVKGTPYGPAVESAAPPAPIDLPLFDRLAAEWIETYAKNNPGDLDGAAVAGQMAGWIRERLK